MKIRWGEIYLDALDPAVGREIAKTRPVIVLSNNIGNKYAGIITVVPVTSKNLSSVYPFEVVLPSTATGLENASKAKADQIRTLDKRRLVKHIGKVPGTIMDALDQAVKIHLELT